jgi:hypothetical protein
LVLVADEIYFLADNFRLALRLACSLVNIKERVICARRRTAGSLGAERAATLLKRPASADYTGLDAVIPKTLWVRVPAHPYTKQSGAKLKTWINTVNAGIRAPHCSTRGCTSDGR